VQDFATGDDIDKWLVELDSIWHLNWDDSQAALQRVKNSLADLKAGKLIKGELERLHIRIFFCRGTLHAPSDEDYRCSRQHGIDTCCDQVLISMSFHLTLTLYV